MTRPERPPAIRIVARRTPEAEPTEVGAETEASPSGAQEVPPEAGSHVSDAVGSRLRESLRCPFCRDSVGRKGSLVCDRPGCGAFYHEECWRELLAGHGACAVFGCTSRDAHRLSTWGWLFRFLRLCLAIVLFPPRVLYAVNALRTHPDRGSIARAATSRSISMVSKFWGRESGRGTIPIKLGLLLPGYGLAAWLLLGLGGEWLATAERVEVGMAAFWALVGAPTVVVLLSYLLAILGLLGAILARSWLEGEFALLSRLGLGGKAGKGKRST